ncbi:unnamed protein product [Somion occarium]|uniref:GIT Spa2 homology (SHD) domain-containing protein n=1 Tax=Somion occarium TaxID=3059160 RepID=A0ABP1DTN9_9APHY
MKRNGSASQRSTRVPSPTNTTYSGFSNYRTESYRPLKEPVPPFPPVDSRTVARTHFDQLHRYLASYLAKEPANSRSTARQKLTRLTRQQFQELSTDVYDELVRRQNNTTENEVPFLPVRDDFHPKRNQARQKLATLPTGRFKDLSSDVYYELSRRYPEFKDDVPDTANLTSPGSTYDDYPSPEFATTPQTKAIPPSALRSSRASEDRPPDPYAGGSARRPSEDFNSSRRSEDIYGGMESYNSSPAPMPPSASVASRRKPSQDLYSNDRRRPSQDSNISGRRSTDRDYSNSAGRRPSESVSVTSDSTSTTNAQSATAGMGMIIPNKSTIAEEEIEVPYGREVRDSTGTAVDERGRDRDRTSQRDQSRDLSRGTDTDADGDEPGIGGLSGLSARLQQVEGDDDEGALSGAGARSGDDYYEKMSFGRASVASDRSAGGTRNYGGRSSVAAEDQERIRRDYEYKIATMQTRITTLERDLEDSQHREQKAAESEQRVRQMEGELEELRQHLEEKTSGMRTLQKELDELREDRSREKDLTARRVREDEEEIQILRERCERLEAQNSNQGDLDILEQLRSDMEGLITELSDLQRRNDELMTAKDSDLIVIRDLDAQLKEYKRKYEQAKTELRSVKATSQLFLQPPKTDDQLPVSPDGGLLDIHVTAFVSAIDSLLTAGRSNAPTRVLTPMKAVINAVTTIVEDVRLFDRRPRRDRSEVDVEALRALRERAEATLSNLVTASKTHATSSGMSPVSLLDAAASHVSSTITEIAKTVCIRKATKAEQDQFVPPPLSSSSPANGFSPSLRSVEERSLHSRGGSSASVRSAGGGEARFTDMPSPPAPPRPLYGRTSNEDRRRPPSNPSSSDASANSPPPIFDHPTSSSTGITSDDSATAEGPEDAWMELKPYLEAQTESIVFAIQSVLSGVRSPTPSPTLNENITQIITIVSSIVAVCKDSLPPASATQGEDILRELSEHANTLSEVQSLPEVTKESRQIMAKSSFAVANAMKGLMKL